MPRLTGDWDVIDTSGESDGPPLTLLRRGDTYLLRVGEVVLMTSEAPSSEIALAMAGAERVTEVASARVLVGGLGFGFTTRALLDALSPAAEVYVAELHPAVVRWNRGPLGRLANHPLLDPRVRLEPGDVQAVIDAKPNRFDVILLDVDNGPHALTRVTNCGLYSEEGLAKARAALRPRGSLVIWSAAEDDAFARRLEGVGFEVELRRVQTGAHKRARDVLFIGRAR